LASRQNLTGRFSFLTVRLPHLFAGPAIAAPRLLSSGLGCATLQDSQRERDRVAEDAVAVFGLGIDRVSAGGQAKRVLGGQYPGARCGLSDGAERYLVAAHVVVKLHLGETSARVGVVDDAGGQRQVAAGRYRSGTGCEGANLRTSREEPGQPEIVMVEVLA